MHVYVTPILFTDTFALILRFKTLAMTKFCVLLIQQKEPLQPSKPKLPTRNLLLTPASAQKTPTPPPRSPTLAVSMLRHLRERRAAPKHSSI